MTLTREAFLNPANTDVELVTVPGFDDKAYMRLLSVKETDKLKPLLDADAPTVATLATIVLMGLADETGKPLLTNDDHGALLDMPFKTLNEVARAILEFNGMTEKAADAIAKN